MVLADQPYITTSTIIANDYQMGKFSTQGSDNFLEIDRTLKSFGSFVTFQKRIKNSITHFKNLHHYNNRQNTT